MKAKISALLCALALFGVTKSASGEPPWPSNVRVTEAWLAQHARKPGVLLRLPQLRAYDSKGHRLFAKTGYNPDFVVILRDVFKGRGKAPAERKLSEDLSLLVTEEGQRVEAHDSADFTLVEYWAPWCRPCHAQSHDLKTLLAQFPHLRFNLVHVDTDRK